MFAVVDVETTGLSPKAHRILDLAVVRVDARGEIVDEWATLINPEGAVGATHIHGITARDVVHAPAFRDVVDTVTTRLSGLTIAAHNARFDLGFIRAELERSGHALPWSSVVCTLDTSRHYFPNLHRRRLADCCDAAGVQLTDAHSALGDARATAGLLRRYVVTHPIAPSVVEAMQLRTFGPVVGANSAARVVTGPSRTVRRPPASPAPGTLMSILASLSLAEVIDEGAPEGSVAYLELLAEALQDGQLSDAEHAALQDIASFYDLMPEDLESANRAMLLALSHLAIGDGRVTAREREELLHVAGLLQVDATIVRDLLAQASGAREARLGAKLRPLPPDWAGGEPLRVADRVAFTGGDPDRRAILEQRAEELGVRVMGNVSRLTAVLVTDGSFIGGKARKAAEHGTRLVGPDEFERLLAHLQPALPLPRADVVRPAPAAEKSSRERPDPDVAGMVTVGVAPRRTQALPTESPAVIRQWARSNGFVVGDRGRLPVPVLEAYRAAHASQTDAATGSRKPPGA